MPRVIHKNKWEKYGADVVMRIIDALVKAGQITFGSEYVAGRPAVGAKSKYADGVIVDGAAVPGTEQEGRQAVPSKHHVVVVRF